MLAHIIDKPLRFKFLYERYNSDYIQCCLLLSQAVVYTQRKVTIVFRVGIVDIKNKLTHNFRVITQFWQIFRAFGECM